MGELVEWGDGAVAGELVSPAHELVEEFVLTLGEGSKAAETAKTYRGACVRFAGWLVAREGPGAGPEAVTLAALAAYEAELRARGLAEATVRKDRSAINRWVRHLSDFGHLDSERARLVLARRLPPGPSGERARPKALDELAWRRLVAVAEAQIAHHSLQGWRDLAMIRVLGDAGLRCEELVDLERRDFVAKRKGATLRALDVRHGKRNRRRKVELKPQAERALQKWDELRSELGPPPGEEGLPPSRWPLFITLGRRRRDGSYTRLGQRATHDVAQDLVARLGARAEIPDDLRHPHVLRHTFATRYYAATHDLAGLQRLLGHADPKTTMVYVDDRPGDRERLMLRAADDPTTLDTDRDAA